MSDPAQSSTENPRSRTYKGLRQLGRFVIHAPCGGHDRGQRHAAQHSAPGEPGLGELLLTLALPRP